MNIKKCGFGITYNVNKNLPLKLLKRKISTDLLDKQKLVLNEDIKAEPFSPAVTVDVTKAKPYSSLPGPSRINLIRELLPKGKYSKVNMIELNQLLRATYGDIYRIKGLFGMEDTIFTYNAQDFEIVYRNEGIWPKRIGLQSLNYYRRNIRPEVFQGYGGLISEQGKVWGDMRSKVNPILMKSQNIRQSLSHVDEIAQEFIKRLDSLRIENTNEISGNFHKEVQKWAFESITFVALNRRLGLLSDNPYSRAVNLDHDMDLLLKYAYEFDVKPSIWPYLQTRSFKHYLKICDKITDTLLYYIKEGMAEFQKSRRQEAKSILEKLLKIDERVALVMVMDMLMAGVDTVSTALVTLLYSLAINPEKQLRLREEMCTILPSPWTRFTEDNTRTMPYMKACLKESLRMMPVTPGNMRGTVNDVVLSGYHIPANCNIMMGVMALSNTETYFPKSDIFLPERWLKNNESTELKSKNPFVYSPFGFGPRSCIGRRIAQMEIESLVGRLVRNYHISWLGKEELRYDCEILTKPCGEIRFKFQPIH
uniref:Cytochrome P450 n=1 Tax=Glossina brevipalpis TaxID=37001 RepID=A0A1A9VZ41_9MUSC